MKKIKFGKSFFLLILVCLIFKKSVIFFNYLSALILHEIAHLLVAKSKGYSLKCIKFDILGMSVDLNEKIEDSDNFSINIAGPLCNLIIVLFCMALYWLIPVSFKFLNLFCVSNLTLAVFNILPIYPLDGGKIFNSLIKNNKTYNILGVAIRIIFVVVFVVLFLLSFKTNANYFYLVFAIFFATSSKKRAPTLSIFKNSNKKFEEIRFVKVDCNQNLYDLIKKIKSNKYTIFYHSETNKFINEDDLIALATSFPLSTNVKDIKIIK